MFNIGDKVRIKEGTVTPVEFENNIGYVQSVSSVDVTVVNKKDMCDLDLQEIIDFETIYDYGFYDTFSHEDLELEGEEDYSVWLNGEDCTEKLKYTEIMNNEFEEMSMDDVLFYNINYPNSNVEFIKSIDTKEEGNDLIESPNHYTGEVGLEVEEVLRNFIPRYEDAYVAHRIASAIEYLLRSPLKNGTQDLEKARYNIGQALEHIGNKDND